jgi:hypothetical protein
MNEHGIALSRSSGSARGRVSKISEAFEWAHQTMDLLRQLDGVLSNTVEAWKSFESLHGDMCYFRDTEAATMSPHAHRSISSVRAKFRILQWNQRKMAVLNARCSNFSQMVSRIPSYLLTEGLCPGNKWR